MTTLAGRRHCLRHSALLGLGVLAGCAGAPAPAGLARHESHGLVALRLADGVYLLPGQPGAPGADNGGRVGNAGLLVGPDGALLIDMGSSHLHGQALLGLVRSLTSRPLRVALITHTRPEFLFGASAFSDAGVRLRTHRATAQLMRARCDTCLKNLRLEVGAAAMASSRLVVPDDVFDGSHALTDTGRPVRVLHFGHASGPGDTAVFDETSGVLFAGGLADHLRVPDIQDGRPAAWLQALADLRRLAPRQVVPGHGPAGGLEVLDDTAAYLRALEAAALQLARQGVSLLDVPDRLQLPRFAAWDQYDTIHPRNASIAYLRHEREALFQ